MTTNSVKFSYISDQIIFEARRELLYKETTYKYELCSSNIGTQLLRQHNHHNLQVISKQVNIRHLYQMSNVSLPKTHICSSSFMCVFSQ
jgi:hypothetical protein